MSNTKYLDGYRFNLAPDGIYTPGATSIIKYSKRIADPDFELRMAELLAEKKRLGALGNKEMQASADNWENAQGFGTALHEELEACWLGSQPTTEPGRQLWSRLIKDLKDYENRPEVLIHSPDLWLLGRADLVSTKGDEVMICDYKTTSKAKPKCYAGDYLKQLGLYSAHLVPSPVGGRLYYWIKNENRVSVTNFSAEEVAAALLDMRYFAELFKDEYFEIVQCDNTPKYWRCKPLPEIKKYDW